MANPPAAVMKTDEKMRSNIRAIIKLLIDERDHWNEQVKVISRADLLADMQDQEGYIFEALQYCSEAQIPPTENNIVVLLDMQKRIKVADPAKYVHDLLEEHKDDTSGLRALGNFVSIWLQERKGIITLMNIQRMMEDPTLDYTEKWEKMHEAVMKISPLDSFVNEDVSESQFRRLVYEDALYAAEMRAKGLAIGPQFPFEAAQAMFPAFEWGEVSLLTGRKGMGKTTLVGLMSEHIAWRQNLGCDAHIMQLETPPAVTSRRQFSRYNIVPYNDVLTDKISPTDEKWKPVWDRWIAAQIEKTNNSGMIRVSYAPGAGPDEIIALMARSSEASLLLGRKCVFFVDHLHSIEWQSKYAALGEFGARRQIFEDMAAAANRLNVRNKNHLFVFAQEGATRGETFGGKFQSRRAQYVFSLARETFGEPDNDGELPGAAESLPMRFKLTPDQARKGRFEADKKESGWYFALDALGNRRFWHRAGDKYGHHSSIRAIYGNDISLGVINTLFEAPMSRMSQDPEQVEKLRKDGLMPPPQVKK